MIEGEIVLIVEPWWIPVSTSARHADRTSFCTGPDCYGNTWLGEFLGPSSPYLRTLLVPITKKNCWRMLALRLAIHSSVLSFLDRRTSHGMGIHPTEAGLLGSALREKQGRKTVARSLPSTISQLEPVSKGPPKPYRIWLTSHFVRFC